jgi:soluble lytic murein transglycosylase-like protein
VDPCLLAGLMYVESRGRVDAVSPAGALGLFQLMPAAAADAAGRLHVPPPTREQLLGDPLLNARLAASHLAWLYRNEGPDLERVLVAYNAGRGKLRQWLRDAGTWSAWRAKQVREGDSETLLYAQQVLEFAQRFRERGVVVPPPEPPPATVQAAEPAALQAPR